MKKHTAIIVLSAITTASVLFSSCTMTFQNINSEGVATDQVDDTDTASPTVSPDITVPVSLTGATAKPFPERNPVAGPNGPSQPKA